MTEPGEFEPVYDELYRQMQAMLPERCKGCGHTSKGLRRLTTELVENQITSNEALQEMQEAAIDIERYCVLGYVASTMYVGKYVCSFEIKPESLEQNREINKYFDVRFEN